jgi:hypothetical protein
MKTLEKFIDYVSNILFGGKSLGMKRDNFGI